MNGRLDALVKTLGEKPFLDGEHCTAGDLMMASVLRFHAETCGRRPRLAAYLECCTARLAFQQALDAQLGDFRQAA